MLTPTSNSVVRSHSCPNLAKLPTAPYDGNYLPCGEPSWVVDHHLPDYISGVSNSPSVCASLPHEALYVRPLQSNVVKATGVPFGFFVLGVGGTGIVGVAIGYFVASKRRKDYDQLYSALPECH
jgi:hypothetical protein